MIFPRRYAAPYQVYCNAVAPPIVRCVSYNLGPSSIIRVLSRPSSRPYSFTILTLARLRRRSHALRRSIELLDARGITVDSIATTGPGHAGEIARCAVDRGADLILVAGGDGTINEAVNGMVHSDVPLGILPAGTANVLANELGIGKTMERAAAVLADTVQERVALGLIAS